MTSKRAWMEEYLIESFQHILNVLVNLEKLMVVLDKLEAEEMMALAMIQ